MVMGRNGGVRQHRVENSDDECNWNPLGLQKWHPIVDAVICTPSRQMIVQHRDAGPWGLDGMGRRSGQTLGIP